MSIDSIPDWGLWGLVKESIEEAGHPNGGTSGSVDVGVRHVTEDGSDTNDGLNPGTAMASPQAAYDDLVAYALANVAPVNGRIHVGKVVIHRHTTGFYDVGDRLALLKQYSAEFYGEVMTRAQNDFEGMARIGTTSSTATEVVALTDDLSSTNGYGFKFVDLGFTADPAVATSLTAMIRTEDVSFTDVSGCHARMASPGLPGHFIVCDVDVDQDNSWWSIENNRVTGMGLVRCIGTDHNNNRWWVAHNQVFSTITGTGQDGITALMELHRVYDGMFIGNSLESADVGAKVSSGGNNVFINNFGEGSSYEEPFYWFADAGKATIVGGRYIVHSVPAAQTGIFLSATGGSGSIVVINPALVAPSAAATNFKDRISDTSTTKGAVQVFGPRGFELSTAAFQMPQLGDNPAAGAYNRNGSIWYDEVNHEVQVYVNGVVKTVTVNP